MKKLACLFLLVATSCATPTKTYVDADAATYRVLAPAHRAYVEADVTLDAGEKQRRLDLLESWRIRVEKAGGVVR